MCQSTLRNIALRKLLGDVFAVSQEIVELRLEFYGVQTFERFCEAVESIAQLECESLPTWVKETANLEKKGGEKDVRN